MDILSWIESEDVAKHLKTIKYAFSSMEAAVVVYNHSTKTLKEKQAAWREIIDTMPDCSMNFTLDDGKRMGLHDYLENVIKWQNSVVSEVYSVKKHQAVFNFYVNMNSNANISNELSEEMRVTFSDLQGCLSVIAKLPKEYVRNISLNCTVLDCNRQYILTLNSNQEILQIESEFGVELKADPYALRGQNIILPLPFQKGDLVKKKEGEYERYMVYEGIGFVDGWQQTNVYAVGGSEKFYKTTEDGYTFRYARNDELEGYDRLLIPFSQYMKNIIDLTAFTDVCNLIVAQERLSDNRDILKTLGIKEK